MPVGSISSVARDLKTSRRKIRNALVSARPYRAHREEYEALSDHQIGRLGAWVDQELPGFVAMSPRAQPRGKAANWGNAFLPGAYSGIYANIASMKPDDRTNVRNPCLLVTWAISWAITAATCSGRSVFCSRPVVRMS